MIDPIDYTPDTLCEAIKVIVQYASDEDIEYIENHGAESMHHGFGTRIRNAWLHDNPKVGRVRVLAEFFRQAYGLGHPDDMSGMILKGVTAIVREEHFDPETDAEHYREFWSKQGIDPMTQEHFGTPPRLSQRDAEEKSMIKNLVDGLSAYITKKLNG